MKFLSKNMKLKWRSKLRSLREKSADARNENAFSNGKQQQNNL